VKLLKGLPSDRFAQEPWFYRKTMSGILSYFQPYSNCEAIVVPLKRKDGRDYVAVPWVDSIPDSVSLSLPEEQELEEAA
jgi:hypothetical protein